MIELSLTLKDIQSSFMVYKWTLEIQFSFEYCIYPKDHKSEKEYKAIAAEGAIWPKLYAKDWLVQPCKMEE